MTHSKEEICILALSEICKSNFESDEYSLQGPKESAVCIEKIKDGWSVYENERNSRNDSFLFDNVVEAALDFLRRLCAGINYNSVKNSFLDLIIGQRIA